MSSFKTVLLFLFGGALLGNVVGTLMGRSMVPWWYTPGANMTVQAQFPQTAVDIIANLITFQLWGLGVGALAGLVVGILVARAASKRVVPPATSTPPPAGT
jgi:uncharacterized membrane protein SpoIIM required for sporulation